MPQKIPAWRLVPSDLHNAHVLLCQLRRLSWIQKEGSDEQGKIIEAKLETQTLKLKSIYILIFLLVCRWRVGHNKFDMILFFHRDLLAGRRSPHVELTCEALDKTNWAPPPVQENSSWWWNPWPCKCNGWWLCLIQCTHVTNSTKVLNSVCTWCIQCTHIPASLFSDILH